MAEYICKPHEKKFEAHPVIVTYTCEFCNEGEMKAFQKTVKAEDIHMEGPIMIAHKCEKCGKIMQLPKSYPRIEWEKIER